VRTATRAWTRFGKFGRRERCNALFFVSLLSKHRYENARKIKEAQDAYCENALAGRWEQLQSTGTFPEDLQWEPLVAILRGQVKVMCSPYLPSILLTLSYRVRTVIQEVRRSTDGMLQPKYTATKRPVRSRVHLMPCLLIFGQTSLTSSGSQTSSSFLWQRSITRTKRISCLMFCVQPMVSLVL
jgi:hypothetical protein